MSEGVTGLSSMATRALLAELSEIYASRAGVPVLFESVGGVDAARRLRAGEAVDLVVLASGAMEALERDGFLVAGSRVAFARSPMAAAVASGTPQPNLADEEAVRRAMLDARSIGLSTGPSGDQLKRLWQGWGIADALAGRVIEARPGVPVGTLVARGEAELGFQQLSELRGVDGIDIVGGLPAELGTDTVFVAGLASAGSREDAARAVLAYLASDDATGAKRRHGMEPATLPP